MNSNDILAVVLNHKILNKKFCDITTKNSIEKLPTTIDIDNIKREFYKTNLSRMNSDYAWRIAVSYLN
ncbi:MULTISPECIES: hypothetical protein [Paenibacillus]|uniref:Uncharacterized protein n=1 Tax=Paenibacillus macerans TaxID=44252 RepID=A0A6N8F282_PAEMA|nr:hypothetical protein [Paenibacillus macerans]MEC0333356.1 hypothetical protein [Paenibacillus macerans]MUG25003.1 hypothetical protein [Paenibacillus macerans]